MIMLRQPLRANRLSGFNVVTDDQEKKCLLALG
jgi:hypothetical protein